MSDINLEDLFDDFGDLEGLIDDSDLVRQPKSDLLEKERQSEPPEPPEPPDPEVPKEKKPKRIKSNSSKKKTKKTIELETKILGPQEGPQEDFLSTKADICLFGGGAGGGKTAALILETMRNINVPGFGAVIFRRTSTQIRSQGGLLDETKQWYPLIGGELKDSKLKWIFPNDTYIDMRYLEYDKDKLNYMGSQICLLCFDELTHFSEDTFFYMLSRNRSVSDVAPYVRATCNPDSNSWVATFISWWIGDDGYPIPERAGKLRYFQRYNNTIEWGDSPEELLESDFSYKTELEELDINDAKYKQKAQDLKDRYTVTYKSVTFIPSLVTDNKILMKKNPTYIANLKALKEVEREQLLYGNWKIKSEAGKFFNRDWFKVIVNPPLFNKNSKVVRFWDFASTIPSKANRDPDYTVGVRMRRDEGSNLFYIDDIVVARDNPGEIERIFLGTCLKDKKELEEFRCGYMIRWEEEGGASGKKESWRLKNLLVGFDAMGVKSNSNKETRARALAVQCECANVFIKFAPWNDQFLTTMHMFTDKGAKHDDMVDGSSGAFNCLTTNFIYPTIFGINDDVDINNNEENEKRFQERVQKLEDDFLNCNDGVD